MTEPEVAIETRKENRDLPPNPPGSPITWLKENIFTSVGSSIVSPILLAIAGAAIFFFVRWLVTTATFEPIEKNLTLLMLGQYDRDEIWRVVWSTCIIGGAIGWAAGLGLASSQFQDTEDGTVTKRETWWRSALNFWPLWIYLIILLAAAAGSVANEEESGKSSIFDLGAEALSQKPTLFAVGVIGLGIVANFVARRLPKRLLGAGWAVLAVALIIGFQLLSGTNGSAWMPVAALVGVGVWRLAESFRLPASIELPAKLAAVGIAAYIVRTIYGMSFLDKPGPGWGEFGGLQLNLFLAFTGIVFAFPFGLLLALGRRSKLPLVRTASVTFIEMVRGVPLITLLLMADGFIGFFVPRQYTLDPITRAMIALTLFSAAYIAEIVRGGLAAVPKGQVEAAQALGLSTPKAMRLIVLPQALRATIPSMVGQFISLFKDTTLVSIISIIDVLGARRAIHGQSGFTTSFFIETLLFVLVSFWVFTYSMSRYSQRLEGRLNVSR